MNDVLTVLFIFSLFGSLLSFIATVKIQLNNIIYWPHFISALPSIQVHSYKQW